MIVEVNHGRRPDVTLRKEQQRERGWGGGGKRFKKQNWPRS